MQVNLTPIQPNGWDCLRYTCVIMETMYDTLVEHPDLSPPTEAATLASNRPRGTRPAPAGVIKSQPMYVRAAVLTTQTQIVAFTVFMSAVIVQGWKAAHDDTVGPLPSEWTTALAQARWYNRTLPRSPAVGNPPEAALAYAPPCTPRTGAPRRRFISTSRNVLESLH